MLHLALRKRAKSGKLPRYDAAPAELTHYCAADEHQAE